MRILPVSKANRASHATHLANVASLRPGDANRDFVLDQFDLVRILQGGKHMTSEPATWGEGDFSGGPGGWWGSPPVGDRLFHQRDIVATLQGNGYMTGPYAAINAGGAVNDDKVSIVYHAATGELDRSPSLEWLRTLSVRTFPWLAPCQTVAAWKRRNLIYTTALLP